MSCLCLEYGLRVKIMQHGACRKIHFSTSHVAYFKKLISRQNMLCSEVKLSYDDQHLIFHGTSTTDNIVLTIKLDRVFFSIYEYIDKITFRLNIYHLHKILKRATSYMYHTIHMHIYQGQRDEQYSWMHLFFETKNRMDKFYTRIYPIYENEPSFCVDHLTKMSPCQIIEMTIQGDEFIDALNRFDKDMFQTVSFVMRKKKTRYKLDVLGETNRSLIVRGRTDAIAGRVSIDTTHCKSDGIKKSTPLRKLHYSLEMLSKSALFYKLSDTSDCVLQIFPKFKVLCLQFLLPHNIVVDIILPHYSKNGDNQVSSASSSSDSDSC